MFRTLVRTARGNAFSSAQQVESTRLGLPRVDSGHSMISIVTSNLPPQPQSKM
jgi:hypothetical protein